MGTALLGLLLAAALALPVWAQGGESRGTLTRLLESLVPGLRIEGLSGALSGNPRFTRLTVSDDQGVWLEVLEGSIGWSRLALLRRELNIESLTADRATVHRLPQAAPATPPPADPAQPSGLVPALPQLPVDVRLEGVEIARIALAPPVLGEAIAFSLSGRARLDDAGLDLGLRAALAEGGAWLDLQAALRPATGQLSARATLRGDPRGPLSRVAGLGERPLALDLTLGGPPENAAFALSAAAGQGIGAEIAGTVAAPDLARLAVVLEGRADASGLLAQPLASLAGPLELRLDAAREPDGLVALRALRVAGAAGRIEASGRLDLERDRSAIDLRAALARSEVFAALLPDGIVGWEAIEAEAQATGALAAPRVALELRPAGLTSAVETVQALLGPAPRLALRAEVGPQRIELLTLAGQAVEAELRGDVGPVLDVTFAADVTAPERAVPGLSGALRLRGAATGPRTDPTVTLEAAADRLEAAGRLIENLGLSARIETPASRPSVDASATGQLQDLPLSLALRGRPEDGGWLRLDAAEAALGPLSLTAAGRLNPSELRAEGEARLAAEDLAPLAPLLGQPLGGSFAVTATGSVEDGRQRLAARLEAPRLSVAGTEARRLLARAEGSLAELDLAVSGTVAEVEAEARGRLTEQEDGARRLDLAALRATGFGETVRLAAPARVTLRPDGAVELGAATLALPRGGTLRAEGRWGPERADIRAALAGVNLAAFAPLVPELAPAGTVTGEARVTGPVEAPELVATLRGSGLRSAALAGLPPGEARIELRRAGSGAVNASAEARVGPQQRLAATARFPRGPAADAPFEATLDGALDLGQLSQPFLAAGADRVTGRLSLALRATGTPAEPLLGGEARVANGRYRNQVLGVAVTDIAGTLRPDGRRLRADITARTPGDGRLALAGTIEPLTRFLPVDLTLAARNAQPVSSDLVRATLDADLRLSGLIGSGATLAGPVRVQRAEIRIPDRLGGGVRSLGPVTEVGTPRGRAPSPAAAPVRDEAAPTGGPPIALAIEVSAPRAVFVRGRGVDAELGGQILIGGRIANPEISGELELRRGEIALAGKRLEFDRGRLAWTGGLLPDLALRASSQSGSYTARVEVTGPPTAPEITFSSVPELPQDEVLARLFFDRPLRELSPLEVAQIAASIAGTAGIGPGGGAGFLGRLREGLGLDRLAVGSTERSTTRTEGEEERLGPSVEAGRYVAEGVYVGVKQGTEPGTSRVGVRVDLTPRLRLEAETGDREAGNRVGVSWEWQWGR